MSLNPPAPAFLPQFQTSYDPPTSLGNSTTMSFPLAQLFCRMPPQFFPPQAPSINHHITDGTFLLPSLQLTSQSKPNAAVHQSTPEFSALLSSPLLHQANCLQAIQKTVQQLNQQLKAENLDRQALQLITLQLQNDFALLRYLLFSDEDTAATDFAPSPLINPTLTLTLLLLLPYYLALMTQDFVILPRWALWDHPERKQTNLQTLISNPHPKRRKFLQLRCRTSHLELVNLKKCSPMK